jgi:shikimate kinase
MDFTKVILIGFMGAGKSSVAPLLAEQLGFRSVDADHEVVQNSGVASIREICERYGESHFRELEATIAASHRDSVSVVIATGGGVILNPLNMEHLSHGGGVVIFLRTSFDEVRRRVRDTSSRPLFKDQATAENIYRQRLPTYEKYADFCVTTDQKTPKDICREILTLLGRHV